MVLRNRGPNAPHPRLPTSADEKTEAKAQKAQKAGVTLAPETIRAVAELAAIHQQLPLLLDRECEAWVQSPVVVVDLLLNDRHPLHAQLQELYEENKGTVVAAAAQPFVTKDSDWLQHGIRPWTAENRARFQKQVASVLQRPYLQ